MHVGKFQAAEMQATLEGVLSGKKATGPYSRCAQCQSRVCSIALLAVAPDLSPYVALVCVEYVLSMCCDAELVASVMHALPGWGSLGDLETRACSEVHGEIAAAMAGGSEEDDEIMREMMEEIQRKEAEKAAEEESDKKNKKKKKKKSKK